MDNKAVTSKNGNPTEFKFGLLHLFYAITLIAVGLSFGPATLVLSIVVLVGWMFIFLEKDQENRRYDLVRAGIISVLLFCICVLFLPFSLHIRDVSRSSRCQSQMRQIMLAILNFENANGFFPTDRIVTTSDGTKLRHSWRVMILPYLEERGIHKSYDFNEPWDGPNNSKLATQLSWPIFQCSTNKSATTTSYKLAVGPGTAFDANKPVAAADVLDGLGNTIALIEDSTNPVHWMEPSDLTVDEAADFLNEVDRDSCSHFAETAFQKQLIGTNIALLDSSTFCCSPTPDPPISNAAFLINDFELYDHPEFAEIEIEIKYWAYLTLAIYILLIILPAFYLK